MDFETRAEPQYCWTDEKKNTGCLAVVRVFTALALSGSLLGCAASRDSATKSPEQVGSRHPAPLFASATLILPKQTVWNQPLPVSLVLSNQTREPLPVEWMDPYNDAQIRVFDSRHRPCPVTDFGLSNLARMTGFTVTEEEIRTNLFIEAGSRITTWLGPKGSVNSSFTDSFDLDKCFALKPGTWTVEVRPGSKLVRFKPVSAEFEVTAPSSGKNSVGQQRLTTLDRESARNAADLYLHLIASYEYPKSPRLLASVPVRLGREFDVLTSERQHLAGSIEPRGGQFSVRFQVPLYNGTNFYEGELALEQRDNPWTRPYNDKTPFIYQPLFVLSSNPNAKPFLKRQAEAERKVWQAQNPLPVQQLALVKQNFKRMHPGMTQRKVFELLGLSRWEEQIHPPFQFGTGHNIWDRKSYQLREGEVLALSFDPTTVPFEKTNWITLGNDRLPFAQPTGDYSHSIVVAAELGPETWSKETGFARGRSN